VDMIGSGYEHYCLKSQLCALFSMLSAEQSRDASFFHPVKAAQSMKRRSCMRQSSGAFGDNGQYSIKVLPNLFRIDA
jgi:hypothetical protein